MNVSVIYGNMYTVKCNYCNQQFMPGVSRSFHMAYKYTHDYHIVDSMNFLGKMPNKAPQETDSGSLILITATPTCKTSTVMVDKCNDTYSLECSQ